ncbi:hypothetical protein BVC80_1245g18 [Macleaya cordata]|uniref:Uncharacterized protein n=1 Tax=Macleaya cordata TaxID=56857 RepID=A0A200QIE4_MACCD|nr:hypothetical protein BVC80_1245g18 [Macleaya cordata]
MAVLPTSVPSSSDHNPLPNPSNSAAKPNPQSTQQGGPNDDAMDVLERKPDLLESCEGLESAEYTEKYKKYEADYVRRIKAKYFSKKNLYGGNIFENETVIENDVIKSSRWPCTRSFTDPVQSFEDHSRSSAFVAETSNPSNKKYQCKKSSS